VALLFQGEVSWVNVGLDIPQISMKWGLAGIYS